MTTVVSDENRRDNQFNGNLLETATYPTATFTLTAPIDLGGPPADATPVSATATGDLTLKDTTKSVTFDVQAQKDGDSIQVVGSTDILFADYGIPRPDVPGHHDPGPRPARVRPPLRARLIQPPAWRTCASGRRWSSRPPS